MGALVCDSATAKINSVATADLECAEFTVGTGADEVTITNGLKISSISTFDRGDVLNYHVNYGQEVTGEKLAVKVYAVATTNGGDITSNLDVFAKVIHIYSSAIYVNSATHTSISCDSSIKSSDCDEGFSGEDIVVWLGNQQVMSAGSSVSLTIDSDKQQFDCSGRHVVVNRDVRTRIDANDIQCFGNKITVDLVAGLAAGEKLHLETEAIGDDCASNCSINYSLFLHDADSDSRINLVSYFYFYEKAVKEKDSLTAVIAFLSLLMAIWYFRREKALKAA
jgi:hypothetical protein